MLVKNYSSLYYPGINNQSLINPKLANQTKLSALKYDTFELKFKGKTADDQLNKIKSDFETLNNNFLACPVDQNNIKDLSKIINKLKTVINRANKKNLNFNIDSKAYLAKFNEALKLPADDPNCNNAIYDIFFLSTTAYKQFDDKTQRTFEDKLYNILRAQDINLLNESIFYFFEENDKHQDKDFQTLNDIVSKLKACNPDNTVEHDKLRNQLILQELKILSQEIFNPSKYLKRSIKMNAVYPLPENDTEASILLQKRSLLALLNLIKTENRIELKPKILPHKELADKLFNLYKEFGNSKVYESQKDTVYSLLMRLYPDMSDKQKQFFKKIVLKHPKFNIKAFEETIGLNDSIVPKIRTQFLKQYQNPKTSIEDKKRALIYLTRLNAPQMPALISDILKDNEANPKLKLTAIWATGFYKTPENKKILLDIIKPQTISSWKPNSTDDFITKQIALSAIAEYKDSSVTRLLNKIAHFESDMAEIASELILRRENTLETQEDFFITKYGLTPEATEKYKTLRVKYVPNIDSLSIKQKNWLDKALLPHHKILKASISKDSKFVITNDLMTLVNKRYIGAREGTGYFWDVAPALMDGASISISKNSLRIPYDNDYLFGHEWGHQILCYFYDNNPTLFQQIKDLYSSAKSDNKLLDDYAEVNAYEYFCQGNEAFLCPIKAHKTLIDYDDFYNSHKNTKFQLKFTDPELFNFIEKLYEKYSK